MIPTVYSVLIAITLFIVIRYRCDILYPEEIK